MKKGFRIFFTVLVVGILGSILGITLHHVRLNRIVEGIGKPELEKRISASRKMMRMGRRPTKVLAKQSRSTWDNVVWALEAASQERDIKAIAMIARDLNSETAKAALIRLGERAVPALVEILQQDYRYYDNRIEAARARAFAAEMLGQIKAPSAVEPLMRALEDEYRNVRLAAAGALVEIGDPKSLEAVALLMEPYRQLLHNRYLCWAKADAEERIRETDETNNNSPRPLVVEVVPLERAGLELSPLRIVSIEQQERMAPTREEALRREAEEARKKAVMGQRIRLRRGPIDLTVTRMEVEPSASNLRPSQPGVDAVGVEGETLRFRVTVKNVGEGDLGRDFMVGLYVAGPPPVAGKVDKRAVAGYQLVRQSKFIRSGEEQTVEILFPFSSLEHYRIEATEAFERVPDQRFAEDLIEALQDPSWVVRRNAVRVLGELGRRPQTSPAVRQRIVQTLMASLTHSDENVRYVAAQALGIIGAKEAGSRLVASLQDPSWLVRQAVTQALQSIADDSLIPALQTLLSHREASVRLNAYRVLHEIGPPQGHSLVLKAIHDPEPTVRANVIAELFPDLVHERRLPTLLQALRDPEPIVRAAAARVLAQWADPQSEPALIAALEDEEGEVRAEAARALGAFRDPSLVPVLIRLSEREAGDFVGVPAGQKVDHPELYTPTSKEARAAAIEALGKIGGPEVVSPIFDALNDSHWKVLLAAIQAMERMSIEGASLFQEGDIKDVAKFASKLQSAQDPLSAYLQSQLSPQTRRWLQTFRGEASASQALEQALIADLNRLLQGPCLFEKQRFAEVKVPDELQKWVKRRPQGDALIRLNRALLVEAYPDELTKSRIQTALDKLISILKDDKALIRVRLAAASTLRALRAEEAVEAFVDLLNNPNVQMKIIVSAALVEMGDRRGRKTLAEQVRSKDVSVRREAGVQIARMDPKVLFKIRGLKRKKHDGLVMLFEDLYKYGQSVYPFTVEAFLRIGRYERLLQRLRESLQDDHPLLRAAAMETLARMGEPNLGPILLKALQDPYAIVRRKAVEALGWLKVGEGIEALRQVALQDADEEVRATARRSLRRLGVWL